MYYTYFVLLVLLPHSTLAYNYRFFQDFSELLDIYSILFLSNGSVKITRELQDLYSNQRVSLIDLNGHENQTFQSLQISNKTLVIVLQGEKHILKQKIRNYNFFSQEKLALEISHLSI